jgi:hypothetical protein
MSSHLDMQVGGSHYKDMKIQPFEFFHSNNIPAIEACAIKYICRHKSKDGKKDLEKAIHVLQVLIELEYPDGNSNL